MQARQKQAWGRMFSWSVQDRAERAGSPGHGKVWQDSRRWGMDLTSNDRFTWGWLSEKRSHISKGPGRGQFVGWRGK